jgi:hypothetical protein
MAPRLRIRSSYVKASGVTRHLVDRNSAWDEHGERDVWERLELAHRGPVQVQETLA